MIAQYPEEGGEKAKQKKSIANVQKKKKRILRRKKEAGNKTKSTQSMRNQVMDLRKTKGEEER